jgi:hypothetical protein
VSGYAAAARIQRAAPRLGPSLVADDRPRDRPPQLPVGPVLVVADGDVLDPLIDRWAAFRDRWAQLTFYLFDGEGWR